jgi:hypothetical protein
VAVESVIDLPVVIIALSEFTEGCGMLESRQDDDRPSTLLKKDPWSMYSRPERAFRTKLQDKLGSNVLDQPIIRRMYKFRA